MQLHSRRLLAGLVTSLLAICCLIIVFFTFNLFDDKHLDQLLTLPSERYVEIVTPENEETYPYRAFKSSSIRPPNVTVTGNGEQVADGLLFLTPKGRGKKGVNQTAPFAFDSDGELVFAANASYGVNDFNAQTYHRRPYLTFWQGKSTGNPTPGHGFGELVFLSNTYEEFSIDLNADINGTLAVDTPKKPGLPPGVIDFHEHSMTDENRLLVTAFNNTPANLTSVGGPGDGWVSNSMFFEIDVRTGNITYQWSPLEHIPLNTSNMPVTSYMGSGTREAPWDFFHTNSVQAVGTEYFLISSRHMWSVYLISRHTGEVVSEFNGEKGGEFGPVPVGGNFRWQHHARAHDVTSTGFYLSLFDNHAMKEDPDSKPSRGLMFYFALPMQSKKAPKLIGQYTVEGDEFMAPSQGSFHANLPPTDAQLVGYGQFPVAREFGRDGTLRWEARYGYHDYVSSYRAFKHPWHATPGSWDPSLVIEPVNGEEWSDGPQHFNAYVSWNGATDVQSWDVFAVENSDLQRRHGDHEGRYLGHAKRAGFETTFEVKLLGGECVRVEAVQDGKRVRASNSACRP
ncbi:hypothetical protein NU195Hw_g4047t1 [Hortaea werneckii]